MHHIHPAIFPPLIQSQVVVAAGLVGCSRPPSQQHFPIPPGVPKVFPGQPGHVIPSASPGPTSEGHMDANAQQYQCLYSRE